MALNRDIPTVLEKIVEGRRGHLPDIRRRIAHVDTDALPRSTRSLYDSLRGDANNGAGGRGGNRFIMECKSSSPSKGLIRERYQPGEIARIYSRYAAGISVLCEPDFFGGDYDHLTTVALSTHLPVLCKDFIIDEVQLYAARYYGADAVLLMLSVLDDAEYAHLSDVAERLGLDVLTEAATPDERDRAVKLGARIIGINHRNLHDLSIDLSRSAELAGDIPNDRVVIAESGITSNRVVREIGKHVNGFLVGSQLTASPDIDLAARELVYGPNKVCGFTTATAAQVARAAGAVYGGLILEEASPRNVSRETAAQIVAAEPGLRFVAVSRRESGWDEIVRCFGGGENTSRESSGPTDRGALDAGRIHAGRIHAVQVHAPYQGSVEAERALIRNVRNELDAAGGEGLELWRAVSMTEEHGPALAEALVGDVDRLVLDSGNGGSGKQFDWSTIPESVREQSLLAGGLTPDNLPDALTARTAGVDINSGLEIPGAPEPRKDAGLLARSFATIRKAVDL